MKFQDDNRLSSKEDDNVPEIKGKYESSTSGKSSTDTAIEYENTSEYKQK